ncbi:MAG TPA: hypothetical protein VN397_02380 [Candidatus Methylomirabilis sp.]|nr:hypothetical protein [Candidatus Methylomirabilis sp.]
MQTQLKRVSLLTIILIVMAFASCGGDASEHLHDGDRDTPEDIGWSNDELKTLNCTADINCQPYEACVQGGWVMCDRGHCAGFHNDTVDFQCLISVYTESDLGHTLAPSICGTVTAPQEQKNIDPGDVTCHYVPGLAFDAPWVRPWIQLVSDVSGATVHIIAFDLYGLRSDGTTVLLAGTNKGDGTVTWAEYDDRSTWYRDGSKKQPDLTIPSNMAFSVPTKDLLIHMGNVGANASGYVDVFVVATVSTTGDAKVQIGLDYRKSNFGAWVREGSLSNWVSCNNGTMSLSTPRLGATMSCDGSLGTLYQPPTTTNACASISGVKITPSSSLLASCSNLIIKTWGAGGTEYASPPGQPLTFTPWTGNAYVTAYCNGTVHTWTSGVTNQTAGFSQVCVKGADLTTSSFVCWDPYSNVFRPTIPLSGIPATQCP